MNLILFIVLIVVIRYLLSIIKKDTYKKGYENACIDLFKIAKKDDFEKYENKRILTTLECWLEDFEVRKEK